MKEMMITMTTDEWDRVLAVLGDGRFVVVNPLIRKILEQAKTQQDVPDSERMVPRLQPVS